MKKFYVILLAVLCMGLMSCKSCSQFENELDYDSPKGETDVSVLTLNAEYYNCTILTYDVDTDSMSFKYTNDAGNEVKVWQSGPVDILKYTKKVSNTSLESVGDTPVPNTIIVYRNNTPIKEETK